MNIEVIRQMTEDEAVEIFKREILCEDFCCCDEDCKDCTFTPDLDDIKNAMRAVVAAAEERYGNTVNIVRCCDCIHSERCEGNPRMCSLWWFRPVEDNDFCSKGERPY